MIRRAIVNLFWFGVKGYVIVALLTALVVFAFLMSGRTGWFNLPSNINAREAAASALLAGAIWPLTLAVLYASWRYG